MGIFGRPVGLCDRCGTDGLPLYEVQGKDVCAACRQVLNDESRVGLTEDKYRELHNLIDHADTNYS